MAGQLVLEIIITNICPHNYYRHIINCMITDHLTNVAHRQLMTIKVTWKDSWLIKSSLLLIHLAKLSQSALSDIIYNIHNHECELYKYHMRHIFHIPDSINMQVMYYNFVRKRDEGYLCCNQEFRFVSADMHVFWHRVKECINAKK